MSTELPSDSQVTGTHSLRHEQGSTDGASIRTNGTRFEALQPRSSMSEVLRQFQARSHEDATAAPPSIWRQFCELALGASGIAVTTIAFSITAYEVCTQSLNYVATGDFGKALGNLVFSVIIGLFVYGSLVYQVTRLAHLQRRRNYSSATESNAYRDFGSQTPSLTILVPSYKEDPRLVRMSLLSAALQNYGHRRVVLLIDDPPNPDRPDDRSALEAMRRLPQELQEEFSAQHARYRRAQQSYCRRTKVSADDESNLLAGLLEAAAQWLEKQAQVTGGAEHVRRTLVAKVLHARANPLRDAASKLRDSVVTPSAAELDQYYDVLARLFDVELTSFERKIYENLSHEPNKAMNLNSYIALLGKSFREDYRNGKRFLVLASDGDADLKVPAADYLITLDADSLILPEYTASLMSLCEASGNENIAVAQTPYSAFPGAPCKLERIAGATTDIQYLIHQGFTSFQGTYWVGANALLRTKALEDIEERFTERGYPMSRFIQDRTVIEDTESSVDLISKGWRLLNYPQRMSYSATPPDFGSLKIQRQRWANGGLIILPRLIHYFARGPKTLGKLFEAFVRFHYLISIAAVNVGLVLLLTTPLVEHAPLIWGLLTAVPYFIAYAIDLAVIGYKKTDVFRVYALNLLLIPVNLVGVGRSLQQAITGHKAPFVRTPKVSGRTRAAPAYVLAVCGFALFLFVMGIYDLLTGHFVHGAFVWANATFLIYAITSFIGWRECQDDLLQMFLTSGDDQMG